MFWKASAEMFCRIAFESCGWMDVTALLGYLTLTLLPCVYHCKAHCVGCIFSVEQWGKVKVKATFSEGGRGKRLSAERNGCNDRRADDSLVQRGGGRGKMEGKWAQVSRLCSYSWKNSLRMLLVYDFNLSLHYSILTRGGGMYRQRGTRSMLLSESM